MTQNLLKIKNIYKIYRNNKKSEKKALNNISFNLLKGEVFSLLGVNGAGKTTLSSIIATLHPPSDGTILWNDRSIYEDLVNYRKIIGFCPQLQNLDPHLSLYKSLFFQGRYYGLSKNELEKRINDLLEKFELQQYGASKMDVLSGGYKQRFLIARALVHNPKLVILDEPTVGLDPQVRRKLWKFISSLKEEGICVLLTTHYLDEAEILSDRVCVIDDGKIVIIDTPKNLINNLKKNNLEEVFLHLLKEEADL